MPYALDEVTSSDGNEDSIVASCATCNEGYGEITIFDTLKGVFLEDKISGSRLGNKQIGRGVKLQ